MQTMETATRLAVKHQQMRMAQDKLDRIVRGLRHMIVNEQSWLAQYRANNGQENAYLAGRQYQLDQAQIEIENLIGQETGVQS